MNKSKTTLSAILFEIAKWGVTVFLLWPLLSFQAQKMPLWRMVAGVMLLVINLGKIFYDIFLDNFKQKRERYSLIDLLMLILGVAAVAALIGGVVLLTALYISTRLQDASAE